MIPYNWRPSQICYRLKCWFKRYTTIKPRSLGHTWQDRCELLPHMMFEILSQFIEEECSSGIVEWYGDFGHKITVDGKKKYVRDEMQDIYDWWHQEYLIHYPEKCERIWQEVEKVGPQDPKWLLFEKECDEQWLRNKVPYREYMQDLHELDEEYHQKRIEMMHRLINVSPYMWT